MCLSLQNDDVFSQIEDVEIYGSVGVYYDYTKLYSVHKAVLSNLMHLPTNCFKSLFKDPVLKEKSYYVRDCCF